MNRYSNFVVLQLIFILKKDNKLFSLVFHVMFMVFRNKVIVQKRIFLWSLNQMMYFPVVSRRYCREAVLFISNQQFIDYSLTIWFYSCHQRILLKNLKLMFTESLLKNLVLKKTIQLVALSHDSYSLVIKAKIILMCVRTE